MIVAVVGPESTGKTALANALAEHFKGSWLPEYARDYLVTSDYTQDDVVKISKEQIRRESAFIESTPNIGFLDTDAVVLRVWWREKYGVEPTFVRKHLSQQPPRPYLLAAPDLEWKYDPLRESQTELDHLFEVYERTLKELMFDYRIVTGKGKTRLRNAADYVQEFMRISSDQ